MLRPVLVVLLLLCGSASAASDAGFRDAEREFVDGNISRAIEKMEALSNSDHVAAQSFLGWLYFDGIFVEQDLAKAASLLEPAAARDDPEANYNLAMILEGRDGIGEPSESTMNHLKAAARGGHPVAQFILGGRYYAGQGISKDPDQGLEWAKKSFANGYTFALNILALHELLAGGAEKDDRATHRKLLRHSREGLAQVYLILGIFHVGGLEGAAEDYDEALKWFYLALFLEHPKAEELLAGFTAKHRFANRRKNGALHSATEYLKQIADSAESYIGKAASWCRQNDRFAFECIRMSITRDQQCRAPFFPNHFQNYRATRAYDMCREKLEAGSD